MRGRKSTLACLCLASALDYADRFALAGLFLPLQKKFASGPAAISMCFLAQNLALAVFSPLWAWFADGPAARHMLLATGALAWGGLTVASAFVAALWQLIVLRALTGAALAALIPVAQSMVADMANARSRGRLYGVVGAASWCGAVGGTIFATWVGDADASTLSRLGVASGIGGVSFVFLTLGASRGTALGSY